VIFCFRGPGNLIYTVGSNAKNIRLEAAFYRFFSELNLKIIKVS
jgi:hypothetical protein